MPGVLFNLNGYSRCGLSVKAQDLASRRVWGQVLLGERQFW